MTPVLSRRMFLAALTAIARTSRACAQSSPRPLRVLLRSSWQTVNIGDIAHTPGMLALLERHRANDEVTLWPSEVSPEVATLLMRRFPKLQIARTGAAQRAALDGCDVFVHGSGPGLVGHVAANAARQAGKPYGFAGVTLSDDELATHRELLSDAKFVFTRDSDSLAALKSSGIQGPVMAFGPDATFALDVRDDEAAAHVLAQHALEPGKFLCAVPRLRWTPYWEIHPERVKPNPRRSAVNEAFADPDHAKLRAGIVAWVRQIGMRVFVVPEMTYAVERLRPLVYDPLPDDVKPSVEVLDRYWLTDEAASVYAQAAAVASFEMHSPIIAIAAGTPAVHLRQPTDTRKGQMWLDVGLDRWLFEIDGDVGNDIAQRLVEIGRDLPAARAVAAGAKRRAAESMATMIAALD